MANKLQGNPLNIDTAMTSGAALGKYLKVTKVIWNNPSAAADTFVIEDTNTGATLLQGYAEAAHQTQVFDFYHPISFPAGFHGMNDWKASTLGSGNLLIYFLE